MGKTIIRTDKLRKEFYEVVAVKDIFLEISEGEIFGLIGPNGAGKTTTIRMLATSLKPTSGTAYIEDLNILKDEIKVRKIIGFMPDFFSLYSDLKVWELLDYFGRAHSIDKRERAKRIDEVIQVANLENKRNSLVAGLSRGMMQRLGLARALIHKPRVLFLDEPASGLDPKARFALRDHLKKLNREGVTVFISSHILTELSDLCTSIGIMEKGIIVDYGPISEIIKKISLPRRFLLEVISDADTAVSILKSDDKVSDLEVKAMFLSFVYKGEKEDIAHLNEKLINKKVGLVSIREETRTLEDIFLKISKGETA